MHGHQSSKKGIQLAETTTRHENLHVFLPCWSCGVMTRTCTISPGLFSVVAILWRMSIQPSIHTEFTL